MTTASETALALASGSTASNLLLRLFVPFVLGALLTLVLTSVSHRRDHIKHVRETLSFALKEISQKGASFWAAKYDAQALVRLRGAVVYLQYILPYALESTSVSEEEVAHMDGLFVDISDAALFVDEELNENSHEIDMPRVARLSVLCANAEALCVTMLLKRMTFWALLSSDVEHHCAKSKKILARIYHDCFVP